MYKMSIVFNVLTIAHSHPNMNLMSCQDDVRPRCCDGVVVVSCRLDIYVPIIAHIRLHSLTFAYIRLHSLTFAHIRYFAVNTLLHT